MRAKQNSEQSQNKNEDILKLFSSGKKQIEISKILNISRQRVSQVVNNYSCCENRFSRKIVLIRDINECQMKEKCSGKNKLNDLVIHHIDLNSKNNKLENLITLCKKCHYFFHQLEKEARAKRTHYSKCKKEFLIVNESAYKDTLLCRLCKTKEYWHKNKEVLYKKQLLYRRKKRLQEKNDACG